MTIKRTYKLVDCTLEGRYSVTVTLFGKTLSGKTVSGITTDRSIDIVSFNEKGV